MKGKFVKIGGVLIVLVALAALIGSTMTFAQDETPDTPETPDTVETAEDVEVTDATIGDTPVVDRFGQGRGGPRFFTREEHNEALAEALNVTVDELIAAQETARQTLIQRAVDEGKITQAQADAILSGEGVRGMMSEIFNPDLMKTAVADALGLTVEELDAAQAEGKRLPEIAAEQGVELSAVQEAVQAAHEEAIAQAVANGLITQEQADQMQSHTPGFGGRGGFGGPRGSGFGPRGGMNGGMGNGRFGGGFQNLNALQGDNG